MELKSYLKFVLLITHLSDTNEANNDSEIDYMPGFPNLYISGRSKNVSDELLYVVGVLLVYGTPHGTAYGERACTGTLIRDDLVVTLASCILFDYQLDADPDTISIFERPTGLILRALKIFINPNFYSEDPYVSKTHDCGLIMVERSNQTAFPELARGVYSKFSDIKSTCVLGGYGTEGSFTYRDFKTIDLKNTSVEEFTGRACFGIDVFCLHFPDIMPCEADYGSALICEGVLYAMYIPGSHSRYRSLSSKCLDLFISVFSPVNNVKDWVDQVVESPSSELEWLNNPWYVLLLCCSVFVFMGSIYYGLVEFLQRNFDPSEGLGKPSIRFSEFSAREDDESEYETRHESQWQLR